MRPRSPSSSRPRGPIFWFWFVSSVLVFVQFRFILFVWLLEGSACGTLQQTLGTWASVLMSVPRRAGHTSLLRL